MRTITKRDLRERDELEAAAFRAIMQKLKDADPTFVTRHSAVTSVEAVTLELDRILSEHKRAVEILEGDGYDVGNLLKPIAVCQVPNARDFFSNFGK